MTSSPSSRKPRLSSVGNETGFASILRKFEQTSAIFILGSGDGTAAQQITRLKVAAIAGVMGQQLGSRPIEIAQVAAAEANSISPSLAHAGDRK